MLSFIFSPRTCPSVFRFTVTVFLFPPLSFPNAQRVLTFATQLGLHPDELLLLRLALLGWEMESHDHTFHEVMVAADNFDSLLDYPKPHPSGRPWIHVYDQLLPDENIGIRLDLSITQSFNRGHLEHHLAAGWWV